MATTSTASKFTVIESAEKDNSGVPSWKFEVLKAPSSQTYQFTNLEKFTDLIVEGGRSDGYTYYHGYILASEVREKKLPLDANPRKPSPTSIVRNMQVTLQKHPKDFHHWNNGMTIICKSISKLGSNKYKIEFGPPVDKHGDGVVNGGHTYYAIEQSNLPLTSNQLVRAELIILPNSSSNERQDIIRDIASKRNDNNELDDKTIAHFNEYYNGFMAHLGADSHRVRWYTGDNKCTKDPLDATSLIALVCTLDPNWFPHHLTSTPDPKTGGYHMSAARGAGNAHKKWAKECSKPISPKNMKHMVPLTRDILELIDYISFSLKNDSFTGVKKVWRKTQLWQYMKSAGEDSNLYFHPDSDPSKSKFKKGYKFSFNFKAMIAGAFRHNVWIGNDVKGRGIKYVGWYIKPIELWDGPLTPMKEDYMKDLNQIAASIKTSGSFGNNLNQSPGAYSIQISTKLFGKHGHLTDGPQMIYDTGSSDKWEKESDVSKITHYLDVTKQWIPKSGTDPFPPLVEMKAGIPPGTETGYRKL